MIEMELRRFEPLEYQADEAINTLCTNLSFAGGDFRKIMVTSCIPQEGKSFITMNLMRSMAKLGMRVVLVDADIRASDIRGAYDVQIRTPDGSPYMGLTRYLAGRCTMDDILAKTNIPNAWMILSGKNVINSLQLFNTPRFGQLLDELARRFDLVLVDVPPVGTIIDAARIGTLCDGTLFVIKSGTVSRQQLMESLQQVEKAGCPVLGCVLNQVDNQRYTYYRKAYYNRGGKKNNPGQLDWLKRLFGKKTGGRKASGVRRSSSRPAGKTSE